MAGTLLGGSRFLNFDGFERNQIMNGVNIVLGGMIYGETRERLENRFFGRPPDRHFISVAPTRSGKGVSLIIPNLLLYEGSCIVIDPKGENAWITAEYRRKGLGQKTIILDPWGEVNRRYGEKAGELETVSGFNPLSILDPASEHYADDIAYLSDALIINQGKDPHWDDSARELVAGLIAYVKEHPNYREEASLRLVRLLLTKPTADICALAEDARRLGPESVAARKLGRFVVDSKEIASIISTALTQTAFLDSNTLAQNLEASDFSFDDLINGLATIYLVLPVDKLQTYGRWLRLMVSIGIRTIARNVRQRRVPVLFVLDEFGTIGKLSAVEQAYGLMAGLQMVLWAFVQDLVQLKRDYPDSWETFIGNSEAVTFMSAMDQFTARYASELLGTTTVERISVETAKAREDGFFLAGDPNYMQMSDQEFARALLQPAEVRSSQHGIAIGRHLPVLFEPLPYHKDPFFLVRARPDPHFPEMAQAKSNILADQERKRQEERARQIETVVLKVLPDIVAAQTAIEKQDGYRIKTKGLLSVSLTVLAYGKEQTFSNSDELLAYAREQLKQWITMTNIGQAFAEQVLMKDEIVLPDNDFWFLLGTPSMS